MMDTCSERMEKSLELALKLQEKFIERVLEYQKNLIDSFNNFLIGNDKAVFRARIQKGGRISIPDSEREALNLRDGELVRIILMKEKNSW
mgnify:CR=1 FL=1